MYRGRLVPKARHEYFEPHKKIEVLEGLQYALIANPPKGKTPVGKPLGEFRNRFAAFLRKRELEKQKQIKLYVFDRVTRKVVDETERGST